MIGFRTLGAVHLRDDASRDLQSVLSQPKRLALLAYLVLARPHGPHRRDSLVALFWPELDAENARNALSQALHFLRRAVGDALQGRHGEAVQIDRTLLSCDALAFEAAVQAGRLKEAVELYGGPLLDGLHVAGAAEFDRWLDAERARLDALHANTLEALANQHEQYADFAGAVGLWQKAAARDPYDSRVALRLMQALVAMGNVAGAMRHARIHEALLRSELDVAPDSSIGRFVASLQATPPPPPAQSGQPMPSVSSPPAAAFSPAPSTPESAAAVAPSPDATLAGSEIASSDVSTRGVHRGTAPDVGRRTPRVLLAAGVLGAVLLMAVLTALRGRSEVSDDERRAMQAYTLGRQQELSRSRLALESAEAYYREAIARKADFAPAYAGLAAVYGFRADYGFSRTGAALDSARRMAQHAYRLDSTSSVTRTALAVSLGDAGHFAAAEAEFTRALKSDSLDARAHYWYSVLLVALGRGHEAMHHVTVARRLDPLGPRGHTAMKWYAQFLIDSTRPHRDLPPTKRREILTFQPGEPWARSQEGIELAEVGECQAAYAQLGDAIPLASPDNIRLLPAVGTVAWLCGDSAGARAVLRRMQDRPDAREHGYRIAMLLTTMGEKDSALAWLRHQRWTMAQLSGLSADRVLDPLRSDPRFHQLMRDIGVRP